MREDSKIERRMVIEIPGEETLLKTVNIPPVEVTLPLEAGAKLGWFGWGLLMPVSAVVGGGASALVLSFLMEPPATYTLLKSLGWLIIGLLTSALVVGFVGAFVTLIVDRILIGRCLLINSDSFTDLRASRTAFQFKDVLRAQAMMSRGGVAAVRLSFRSRVDVRHNPLRLGTIMFPWRHNQNELHLPLLGLTVRARTLALVILKLAKAHGASIEHSWPHNGDWVLQHDVRRI